MSPRTAYAIPLSLLFLPANALASDAVDFAARLIGRPYVWGAEGPDAFDCSGLTQYVFREFGVELPRRAISQSRAGDSAGRGLRRGDLVFFSTDSRRSAVTHVGIYEDAGVMIEASKRYGRVRRSGLNEAYWLERFMFARRIDLRDAAADRRGAGQRAGRTPAHDRRRAAVRVLGRIAEALLRRPRR